MPEQIDTLSFMAMSARRSKQMALRRNIGFLLGSIIAATGLTAWQIGAQGRASPLYTWVQMLPENAASPSGRLVRTIVADGIACPTVKVAGENQTMRWRPSPSQISFPIRLCEASIDAASEAWLGDDRLPARPAEPNTILVLGDTGCRLAYYLMAKGGQNCQDSATWPFRDIAASAARALQNSRGASVMLHVGDFHYRETACADNHPFCGGSPYGDNWEAWKTDFFEPAKKLLLHAPWIMARGNHEDCLRAGAGWLFFFALPGTQSSASGCEHDTKPYSIAIGRAKNGEPKRIVVFDAAAEKDKFDRKGRKAKFLSWLNENIPKDGETWLVVHQPLWRRSPSLDIADIAEARREDSRENRRSALIAARRWFADENGGRNISLIISGDTHAFQHVRRKDGALPIQLIVGNGGTQLDLPPTPEISAKWLEQPFESFGVEIVTTTIYDHGFVLLKNTANGWQAQAFDKAGKHQLTCELPALSGAAPARSCVPTP